MAQEMDQMVSVWNALTTNAPVNPSPGSPHTLQDTFEAMHDGDFQDELLQVRHVSAQAATVFLAVDGHEPAPPEYAQKCTGLLKKRSEAIFQDMFYWQSDAGFASLEETYGRKPATFTEVGEAASANDGELPVGEFLGRWCPVCYLIEDADTDDMSTMIQDIMRYFRTHRHTRPATLHMGLCDLYNNGLVHGSADGQRTLDMLWGKRSDVFTLPLVHPAFFESHFEGGPCLRRNPFFTANLLHQNTVAKIDYLSNAGLYVKASDGTQRMAPRLSEAQTKLEQHMLALEKTVDSTTARLFQPLHEVDTVGSKRPRVGMAMSSANVVRSQKKDAGPSTGL